MLVCTDDSILSASHRIVFIDMQFILFLCVVIENPNRVWKEATASATLKINISENCCDVYQNVLYCNILIYFEILWYLRKINDT